MYEYIGFYKQTCLYVNVTISSYIINVYICMWDYFSKTAFCLFLFFSLNRNGWKREAQTYARMTLNFPRSGLYLPNTGITVLLHPFMQYWGWHPKLGAYQSLEPATYQLSYNCSITRTALLRGHTKPSHSSWRD